MDAVASSWARSSASTLSLTAGSTVGACFALGVALALRHAVEVAQQACKLSNKYLDFSYVTERDGLKVRWPWAA
jgi:hypothetical protein